MTASFGLKMIGSMMVITGTSGYGISLARRYAQRLAELEQLRQMIFLLKGQILYANAPLHEAFETVGRRTEGWLAKLFVRVAYRIGKQDGETFCSIWKSEIELLGAKLDLGETEENVRTDEDIKTGETIKTGKTIRTGGIIKTRGTIEIDEIVKTKKVVKIKETAEAKEIIETEETGTTEMKNWKTDSGARWGLDTALSKEDRQSLASLGEHLGFLDRDMQERNLLLYLEQLDLRIQQLREHKQERCRLYTSLGVMSGLFLAILLV